MQKSKSTTIQAKDIKDLMMNTKDFVRTWLTKFGYQHYVGQNNNNNNDKIFRAFTFQSLNEANCCLSLSKICFQDHVIKNFIAKAQIKNASLIYSSEVDGFASLKFHEKVKNL